jgi:hypothetical protein
MSVPPSRLAPPAPAGRARLPTLPLRSLPPPPIPPGVAAWMAGVERRVAPPARPQRPCPRCHCRCWFFVLYDLVAESWRSPTLAALALLNSVLAIAVSVVGYFTGLQVPQCWVAASAFPDGQALLASTVVPLKVLAVLTDVRRVLFPLSLLAAASRWQSAWSLLFALVVGAGAAFVGTVFDARYCVLLVSKGTARVATTSWFDSWLAGGLNTTSAGEPSLTDGTLTLATAELVATYGLIEYVNVLLSCALVLLLCVQLLLLPGVRRCRGAAARGRGGGKPLAAAAPTQGPPPRPWHKHSVPWCPPLLLAYAHMRAVEAEAPHARYCGRWWRAARWLSARSGLVPVRHRLALMVAAAAFCILQMLVSGLTASARPPLESLAAAAAAVDAEVRNLGWESAGSFSATMSAFVNVLQLLLDSVVGAQITITVLAAVCILSSLHLVTVDVTALVEAHALKSAQLLRRTPGFATAAAADDDDDGGGVDGSRAAAAAAAAIAVAALEHAPDPLPSKPPPFFELLGSSCVRAITIILGSKTGFKHPTPSRVLDLQCFNFLSAFSYIMSYASNLVMVSLILGVIFTGVGFIILFPPLRDFVFRFLILPLLAGEVAYYLLLYAMQCCIARGSLIFMPRLFTWVDLTITSTVTVFVGPATGAARIAFSVFWGLLACADLSSPVLPGFAQAFDSGFNAYGGMLKAIFAWTIDETNEVRQGALAAT